MATPVLYLPWLDRSHFKGTDGYTYLNVNIVIYIDGEIDMTYQVPCRFFFVALSLFFLRPAYATVDIS